MIAHLAVLGALAAYSAIPILLVLGWALLPTRRTAVRK
jgi:hypothetical protein